MQTTTISEWPEPLPELGELIRSHGQTIMEAWAELVEQMVPSSERTRHRVALHDHLPHFLNTLAKDLATGRSGRSRKTKSAAQEHGIQRWRQGWELELVIRDYQLMFHAIRAVATDKLGRELTSEEITMLMAMLHESTVVAIRTFLSFRPLPEPHRAEGSSGEVLNACLDAIIELAVDGTIRRWNRGAEVTYGYIGDDVVGSHISLLVPPERRLELERCLMTLKSGRHVMPFDTLRRRSDGTDISVSISASPIQDDDGNVRGFVTVGRDISDRVRAADVLRDALEEAERANRAKSEFLANVSHELRTPMNAIIGMTELALDEQLSPELKEYLETTRESADLLLTLVNDVLDISKLESGKFALEKVAFSLSELLEETIRSVSARAYRKGLEIVLQIAPNVPDRLYGDPLRLRQIITNLVGNAIKFTDEGEVVVEVQLDSTSGRSCVLRFSVSDTGIGISEEDQQRVFSPFTQADNSTTRRYSGTGLGLAIASHLINCLRGQFWVQSELGVGSVFYFTARFPVADDSAFADPPRAPKVDQLRGLDILVADDNETSREIIGHLLTGWEMKPHLVEDAGTAVQKLEHAAKEGRPIPVAVIDALMPEKDGFELLDEIQERQELQTKTILMLSSTDRLTFKERCQQTSADCFLEKPVSHSNLLDAIVAAMGLASCATEDPIAEDSGRSLPPTRTLDILLVEDTIANRKVAERVLQKRGHRVTTAGNGREAIDHFRQQPFDVVLMDVQMPSMDGLQATEVIRTHETESQAALHTPIIAMTAHAMAGDRQRCLAAGMDDYLSKPIRIRRLVEMVEQYGNWRQEVDGYQAPMADDISHTAIPAYDSASKEQPMDLSKALKRLDGDHSLLDDLIGFFLEDYPGLVTRMREAIAAEESAALQRTAHSLKGLVANFDANRARQLSQQIEDAAKERDIGQAESWMDELESAADDLADQLEHYRLSQSKGKP